MSNAIVLYNMSEAQNAYQRLQATLSTDSVDSAMAEIKTFLKMFPDVALAHNDLAVLHHKKGDKLLALAHYEKANRLQPDSPVILNNLAEFYFVELGWTDDAIVLLTGLLDRYPHDTEILTSLAIISERINRLDEARSFYKRILVIDPENQDVRQSLANLEGPVSAAEYRLPHTQPVVQPVAAPQPAGRSVEEILAGLRTPAAPTVATPSVDELLQESQRCSVAGDHAAAARALEQIIAMNPGHAQAHNDLGVVYFALDDMQKSLYHYEMAVTNDPTSTTYRKNLADLYYAALGRTDEAIAIYTNLLNEQPRDVEVLTALAIIAEENKLREQATVFIKRVLEIEPWNAAARDFLARIS